MNVNDIDIETRIPLTAVITGASWQDDEGEWHSDSATVLDTIVQNVADNVATRVLRLIKTQADWGDYSQGEQILFNEHVRPKLDAVLDERIEQAFNAMVTPPGKFGEPDPDPVPLEQYIAARIDKWLNEAGRDSYGGKGTSRLDKAIEGFMDRTMQKALDDAMAKAKTQALNAFTNVAEAKLADALRESLAAVAK